MFKVGDRVVLLPSVKNYVHNASDFIKNEILGYIGKVGVIEHTNQLKKHYYSCGIRFEKQDNTGRCGVYWYSPDDIKLSREEKLRRILDV